ncbi:hypothetical protein TSUD_375700 [Trifolium subterraneum]|uniref:Uncharacterized protein n=1 Tax=Trifolium subterraneum TaxID=3900 RepID=A0A2Z6P9V7_TRISU|nr:hypothetical protein TSUD_375700 [Trifolium subterraneum]
MIREKKIDFESLSANEFSVKELFTSQGMGQYINLLDGPIYANLVQEFWMKAWILDRKYATEEEMISKHPEFLEPEIHSNIGGLKIKILKGHFAALLRITSSGKQLKNYEKDGIRSHRKALEKIIEKSTIFSKDGEEMDKKGLHGKTVVLYVVFRILINCLIPIYGGKDTVSYPHRHLLFFLKTGVQVNFVDLIFSTLCNEITRGITSDNLVKINIVYPRLLSALFERTGLIELIKPFYPTLGASEDIEVFDAHSLKKMKFISTIAPTPPSESEAIRAQLYCGDLPIISKVDDLEVIKNFLQQVYQDTNIFIPLSVVPDAPQMKNVPKRKRSTSTKKQSKPTIKKPKKCNPLRSSQKPTLGLNHPLLSQILRQKSLQHDLSHLAYLRDEAVTHPDDLFNVFHKIQDYFNASMQTLAVQYVRKSAVATTDKFSRSARIKMITDYPFIQNELSTDFLEFIINCQQQQFAEAVQMQLFEAEQLQLVHGAQLAEAEAIKWLDEEHEQRQIFEGDHQLVIEGVRTTENQVVQWFAERELFEEDHQQVIDAAISGDNDAHKWFEEEDTRIASERSPPLIQISVGPSDATERSLPLLQINDGSFVATIEARLTAQEEKHREMQLTITSLVDSQSEIKTMLALLLDRQQPPQP